MSKSLVLSVVLAGALPLCCVSIGSADSPIQLYVGAATADITPPDGAPLTGGHDVRYSKQVVSPLKANVVAVEVREGERRMDCAILVACDLCVIRPGVQAGFRGALGERLGDFPKEKLVLTATHTHCAPVILQERFKIPPDVVQPKDCLQLIYDRMAEAVEKAWKSRQPAEMAYGLGHAVAAQCRRVVYSDNTAKMYGKIDAPKFRGLENHACHDVDCAYFFGKDDQLMAILVGVWCPAQAGGGSHIGADMWHYVRENVKAEHGNEVVVAGFCGPAVRVRRAGRCVLLLWFEILSPPTSSPGQFPGPGGRFVTVLVVYASKHGSTAEIAEAIGSTLQDEGFDAEILPAAEAGDPASYDAVILGSAIYAGSWLKEALDYAAVHAEAIRNLKDKHRITFVVLRNGLMKQVVLDFARDYEKE